MIGIIGAGDFAKEIVPLLCDEEYTLIDVGDPFNADEYVIAISDPQKRKEIAENNDLNYISIGAESAILYSVMPDYCIICDHVLITTNVKIGKHFHCNIGSYVAHDCVVGDYVTFAPRVCCNGRITIGDNVYIGTGAILYPGITIGKNAVIGMGSVVLRDVPERWTVAGNPARKIK